MGLVVSLLRPRATATRSPFDDFWYQPVGSTSSAGMKVSPDAAMGVSAVWACVGLLADTIAGLPLILYRRVGQEDRERATDQRLYGVLHDAPNDWQDAFSFWHFLTVCLLLRGNAYAYKWVNAFTGEVEQLLPLHPDCVTPERVQVGRAPNGMPVHGLRYRVRLLDGTSAVMTADEIFHVRGLSLDGGLTGVSVIEYARQTVGLSLALEEYAARFFGNGARPGGILAPDAPMTQDALDRLKAEWNATFQGPSNSNKIAALPVSVKYTPLAISNEDSQFLLSREFSAREVARWFGRIPLHMIGEMTKDTAWGTGLESQVQGFLTFSVAPFLTRFTQRVQLDLVLDTTTYYAEFETKGILRADFFARQQGLQIQRQNGIINARQWARLENIPPPDGDAADAYWRPANMVDANAPPEPPAPAPPPPANAQAEPTPIRSVDPHHKLLLEDAAARIVRKEIAALTKAATRCASPEAWQQAVEQFYAEHADFIAQTLHVPKSEAQSYARQVADLVAQKGAAVLESWEARMEERLHHVKSLALAA
jgi:HK97 family phage portal protein